MIGDCVVSEGIEFEVIWDGGEGLVGDRVTRPPIGWTPPHRIYNKSGKYTKKEDELVCVRPVDSPDAILDDVDRLNRGANQINDPELESIE